MNWVDTVSCRALFYGTVIELVWSRELLSDCQFERLLVHAVRSSDYEERCCASHYVYSIFLSRFTLAGLKWISIRVRQNFHVWRELVRAVRHFLLNISQFDEITCVEMRSVRARVTALFPSPPPAPHVTQVPLTDVESHYIVKYLVSSLRLGNNAMGVCNHVLLHPVRIGCWVYVLRWFEATVRLRSTLTHVEI